MAMFDVTFDCKLDELEVLNIIKNHFTNVQKDNKYKKTEEFENELNRLLMSCDNMIRFYRKEG